jgi:hypothetical protein
VKAQTATRLAWSLCAVCVAATIGGMVLADLNGHLVVCAVLHAGGGAAAAVSDRPAAVAPLAAGGRVGSGVHGVGPGRYGLRPDVVEVSGLEVDNPVAVPVAWTPWLDRVISLGALLLIPSIAGAVAAVVRFRRAVAGVSMTSRSEARPTTWAY